MLSINFLWKAGEAVARCMVGLLRRLGEGLLKNPNFMQLSPFSATRLAHELGPSCQTRRSSSKRIQQWHRLFLKCFQK